MLACVVRMCFCVNQTPVVASLSQLAPAAVSAGHLLLLLAGVLSLHAPPSRSVRRAVPSSVEAPRVAAEAAEQHPSANR